MFKREGLSRAHLISYFWTKFDVDSSRLGGQGACVVACKCRWTGILTHTRPIVFCLLVLGPGNNHHFM